MLITNLEIKGLKGGIQQYQMGDQFTCMFGENGTGKTTVLQALQLLLRGKTSRSIGTASVGKDILLLSRRGAISIKGVWQEDSGKSVWVKRTWRKSDTGGVKEVLEQNINPNVKNSKEQQALLNLYFGIFPEVWEPEAFLSLSAEKMRSKLLASVSNKPISDVLKELHPIIGDTLPSWAKPGSLDTTVETWLDFANKEAKKRINEAQAEIRLCKKSLEEEPEFVSHRQEHIVRAEIIEADKAREALVASQKAKASLAFLLGKRATLQEQLVSVEEEIQKAKELISEESSQISDELREIDKKRSKLLDEIKVIGAQAEIDSQQDELQERALIATEEIGEYKELRIKLQASQEYLLKQVKSNFEDSVSKVVGKECVINIDGGKCRFQIGGVDISGLSDGETLSLIPGIIAGLCTTNETKWIPLLVDRFEAISKDRRVDFLKALKALIEQGSISQVFIAGCPDEVPPVPEKTKVHKLEK